LVFDDLTLTSATRPDSELGNSRSRRAHIHANCIVDGYGVPTC
jgi:hypothetical protein